MEEFQKKFENSSQQTLINWMSVSRRIETDYQTSFAQIVENKKSGETQLTQATETNPIVQTSVTDFSRQFALLRE